MMKLFLSLILVLAAPAFAGVEQEIVVYFRGDANGDDSVDISDVSYLNNYLFSGGPAPACEEAADVDASGALDLVDPVLLMQYLFEGCTTCLAEPTEVECFE